MWESLPGLLVSPQRGLAFYSPVLLFGFAGMALAWRQARWRPLVPLQVAVLAMIVVAARWYDWWGGAAWGYRSIVDTAPLLALSMLPAMERVMAGRRVAALFGAALLWSVAAQFVGAWSYNILGWLERREAHGGSESAPWWQRSQIGWHVANFEQQRAEKQHVMRQYVDNPRPILWLSAPE